MFSLNTSSSAWTRLILLDDISKNIDHSLPKTKHNNTEYMLNVIYSIRWCPVYDKLSKKVIILIGSGNISLHKDYHQVSNISGTLVVN